jgi:alpha-N-acetylglucosaminidase
LTLWTSTYNITDYANRQWNGLLGDFYYHRWELWLKALNDSVATGVAIDEVAVRQRIGEWELAWTRQHNRFPSEPRGEVISLSQRLFDKYSTEVMRSSLSENNRARLDASK